ncbi:hypothetical protein [Kordiimonas laminariae]|uniref:hypothetical protein n=1 Tax=Kordiimonas laminariae TaxID=2917717 RepID=UPI001FF0DF56|nr:hypothetical protein [Kordiimonas laminariae]MCK0068988.1 hypothetical protein [Kordiimonas laminariae]
MLYESVDAYQKKYSPQSLSIEHQKTSFLEACAIWAEANGFYNLAEKNGALICHDFPVRLKLTFNNITRLRRSVLMKAMKEHKRFPRLIFTAYAETMLDRPTRDQLPLSLVVEDIEKDRLLKLSATAILRAIPQL